MYMSLFTFLTVLVIPKNNINIICQNIYHQKETTFDKKIATK